MDSYFVLGADGKEYGPVTLDVLKRWVIEGRVIAETSLREESVPGWKHAREFPELAPLVAPISTAYNVESGRAIVATISPEELLARQYEVQTGNWIGQAWRFYWGNWAEITGYALLTFLLQILAGMIPCIGYFAGIFITPMLHVGFYYYLIKKWRAQPTAINDLFAGFQFFYVPALVANLLFILASMVAFLPVGAGVVACISAGIFAGFGTPSWTPELSAGLITIASVCVLLTVMIGAYVSVTLLFWPLLVAGHKFNGWDAIRVSYATVRKHFFGMLGFVILVGLIGLAGVLACVVGSIFSFPLAVCCTVVAYDAVFGPRPQSPSDTAA